MSNRKKIKPKKRKSKSFLEEDTDPISRWIIIIFVVVFLLAITLCKNGNPGYNYYPGKPYFPHENTRR